MIVVNLQFCLNRSSWTVHVRCGHCNISFSLSSCSVGAINFSYNEGMKPGCSCNVATIKLIINVDCQQNVN